MIKTVTTTAGVNTVAFPEFFKYFWIKNTGDTTVYASAYKNVSPAADNSSVINSGDAVCIENVDDNNVYISGAGSVEIHAQEYPDCSFKVAPKGGEIPDLSAYAKKTDIPTELPANGGNADTVNGHSVNADVPENAVFTDTIPVVYGENLLINSNFKINQRGVSGTVSAEGGVIQKFVDMWIIFEGSATINSDGTITLNGTMVQYLENAVGTDVVASSSAGPAEYDDSLKMYVLSASGENISWCKLEHGSVATPFIAPDPVEELMKCQRYCVVVPNGRYFRASFVGTSVIQFLLPLPVSMVNVPSIVSGTMGVIPLNQSTSSQADTSFTFSFTGIKNNLITVQATKSDGAIDGALFVTEELVLSADL